MAFLGIPHLYGQQGFALCSVALKTQVFGFNTARLGTEVALALDATKVTNAEAIPKIKSIAHDCQELLGWCFEPTSL
jgi:hypothetical protein